MSMRPGAQRFVFLIRDSAHPADRKHHPHPEKPAPQIHFSLCQMLVGERRSLGNISMLAGLQSRYQFMSQSPAALASP